MECSRMSALLLLFLGLTWAQPPSLTKDFGLSYDDALELAINTYNKQSVSVGGYAFRILNTEPQAIWDPTLSEPQSLDFTIKETECKRVENLNLEQCPFQDKGQVKNCLGLFTSDKKTVGLALTCNPEKPAELIRTRRGLKKFLKKLKNKVKKLLPKKPTYVTWRKTF